MDWFLLNLHHKMEQNPYIVGIRNGELKIIEEIWRDLFPPVRKWVLSLGGIEDDAKDVFQDAILVVYDKSMEVDFKLANKFSTYFLGICRNLVGNLYQKKYFMHVTITEEFKYIEDVPIDLEAKERRNLLDKAMSQLGKECRKVMELFFEENSMVQIANILGFASEGYAKRRKHQCKESLLELIRQQPGFDELFNNRKP
jgi:RNA polymerase sigma factor (sigma-70 family)